MRTPVFPEELKKAALPEDEKRLMEIYRQKIWDKKKIFDTKYEEINTKLEENEAELQELRDKGPSSSVEEFVNAHERHVKLESELSSIRREIKFEKNKLQVVDYIVHEDRTNIPEISSVKICRDVEEDIERNPSLPMSKKIVAHLSLQVNQLNSSEMGSEFEIGTKIYIKDIVDNNEPSPSEDLPITHDDVDYSGISELFNEDKAENANNSSLVEKGSIAESDLVDNNEPQNNEGGSIVQERVDVEPNLVDNNEPSPSEDLSITQDDIDYSGISELFNEDKAENANNSSLVEKGLIAESDLAESEANRSNPEVNNSERSQTGEESSQISSSANNNKRNAYELLSDSPAPKKRRIEDIDLSSKSKNKKDDSDDSDDKGGSSSGGVGIGGNESSGESIAPNIGSGSNTFKTEISLKDYVLWFFYQVSYYLSELLDLFNSFS